MMLLCMLFLHRQLTSKEKKLGLPFCFFSSAEKKRNLFFSFSNICLVFRKQKQFENPPRKNARSIDFNFIPVKILIPQIEMFECL